VTGAPLAAASRPSPLRAGHRIGATCVAALGGAHRLRALRDVDPLIARWDRLRLLRDLCQKVSAIHGIEVRHEGAIPGGPVLFVSNHVSWLDAFVVGGLASCIPVSKLEVASWPLVGRFARDLGVLFVRRGDRSSGMRLLRGAARTLQDGLPVLAFPEGTTTEGDRVLPFRTPLFSVAHRLGFRVVPVAISYEPRWLAWVGEAAFLPHYLRLAASPGAAVTVRFGPAITSSRCMDGGELADEAQRAVQELLGGADAAAACA
jgi:1-acyl-sn-glycerol-3-phosphate acyltransferase